jgi:hypothetical protein
MQKKPVTLPWYDNPVSWNRICDTEENKETILKGSKFNLKHFLGPSRRISILNKKFLEFVLEKHKKDLPITRDATLQR